MIQLYHMRYVTTNIRLEEEDYLKLKAEAAKRRKSLSAIIREKVSSKQKRRSKAEIEKLMHEVRELAKKNAKHLKGFDSVKALREMRYEDK